MAGVQEFQNTRVSKRWKNDRGFDAVHSNLVFPSDNEFGIPDLEREDAEPATLRPYHVKCEHAVPEGTCLHFYLDDYQFEVVWNRPRKTLGALQRVGLALTPDFSLWGDMPVAAQIYNVYRARWMGCFWQHHGVQVIPSVSWPSVESLEFAILGVPEGSPVALSGMGLAYTGAVTKEQAALNRKAMFRGLPVLIERIKPPRLYVYGKADEIRRAVPDSIEVLEYPSYWQMRREEVEKGPNGSLCHVKGGA